MQNKFAISKTRFVIPSNFLRTFYFSYIGCHLNFSLNVWGSMLRMEKIIEVDKSPKIINKLCIMEVTVFKENAQV